MSAALFGCGRAGLVGGHGGYFGQAARDRIAGKFGIKHCARRAHGCSGIRLSVDAIAAKAAATMTFPRRLAAAVGPGQGPAAFKDPMRVVVAKARPCRLELGGTALV